MSSATHSNIDSILQENRKFEPPAEFSRHAHIKSLEEYEKLYKQAADDPEGFWAEVAKELHWFKPWTKVLEWDAPWAKWFVGAEANLSYNCLDRHVLGGRRHKAAFIWEGEPGDVRTLTYQQLWLEVQKFANVLLDLGIKKGDRVAIYMGMVPELPVAMLACARIGATHSVIFGGFSANALVDRITDQQAVAVITQDGSWRRGNEVKLKVAVDEALEKCPTVKHVVVYKRTASAINMKEGRDHWWHDLMAKAKDHCPAEPLDAEHPLYILYTSGTTGKPKGIVHTTGGYAVGTYYTTKMVFDLKEDDTFWCTADIGWVTGHSYIVYGPLQTGATTVMYEGAPNFPDLDRFWALVAKHKVTVFYTAPTAIRTFMKWGAEYPNRHDMSTLRLLGSVGEPINPEAWMWYRDVIGKDRCPIVDTWWQTETGAIMISPLPGAIATKPGSATKPLPGIIAEVVTRAGEKVPLGSGGFLVIKKPWPSMMRTIYGDPERYKHQYWSDIPGVYFTGDGAREDKDGYFWIMGRVDDVLNVSGHRLSTMEIESALVAHPKVAEAAVVGRPDEMKGQAVSAFVTLESGSKPSPELKEELRAWVAKEIGSMAKPDDIRFTDTLPKTRSGKIMRRLLRELATGGDVKGDTTTLEDFTVIAKLKEDEQ
ncbi:acetyl-coenzyme A synthetase [Candidatus Koribacter versatilis Ellin345]|uniref:Acetyl-coenzyme A synthetase n=1 Tax=Koribacter versatilis (strain Ellin345) TaxID=204669 RepID=Q1IKS9_KORVE|nr:acetate--CoA ligase [Candidatus Koribacter versatilis]ABF42521.1 acetyl-coenzyme A synthetase [Candidatus Koribacter versatilis Ellin345]